MIPTDTNTRVSINNGILEFQKYQLTSHLSFLFNTSPHMQRYHGSEKASNAATRVNVGSHKVKLPTTTAITPLPLVPSKNSGANVFSSGYIHDKKVENLIHPLQARKQIR